MQDPEAAARELERCVQQLGFHGFLVNGFSQVGDENTVVYYDDARFNDFWTAAATLKKPFYMHPRDPLLGREPIYEGAHWLTGPTWAFAMETAIHAFWSADAAQFAGQLNNFLKNVAMVGGFLLLIAHAAASERKAGP